MLGFAILHGPLNRECAPLGNTGHWWLTADLKYVMSKERLPFTATYFGSLGLTLFFAIGLRSTIGTLVAAIVQVSYALCHKALWILC